MVTPRKNHHHSLETRNKVVELYNNGWSSDEIFETTNVAKRTQQRYIKKNQEGIELIDVPRQNEMWNQRNSKLTEDYLKKLKLKLENQNDLTAAELRIQLLSETGINITERIIQQILKDVGFTKKKKTLLCVNAFLPINLQRTTDFVHSHDPKSTRSSIDYRSLLLCSSTDESGFDNQAKREKGWSEIHKIPLVEKKSK
jgi:transposase